MNIAKQLKSKTVWFNLLSTVGGVVAYLAANPATIAAYGPQALVVVTVANIVLRNMTTTAIADK